MSRGVAAVREPRHGLAWSPRRVAIRARYGTYMDSPAWFARRERWLAEWHCAHGGRDPVCLVCGNTWSLSDGDLHHRSYQRIGHEDFRDLTPLCRRCHQALHAVLDGQSSWRRLGRAFATDQIISLLRKQHTKGLRHDRHPPDRQP